MKRNLAFPCQVRIDFSTYSFKNLPYLTEEYILFLSEDLQWYGFYLEGETLDRIITNLYEFLCVGYSESPHSRTRVTIISDGKIIGIQFEYLPRSLMQHYDQRWRGRNESYFGEAPDAKVMAIAKQLGANLKILDIGAGTGRNAIPLATLGHDVEAIEPSELFYSQLQLVKKNLPIKIIKSDFFEVALKSEKYDLIIASEVTSNFWKPEQLINLLLKSERALMPNGCFLLNIFLSDEDVPDTIKQQSAFEIVSVFSRGEFLSLISDLSFTLISDESVLDYESSYGDKSKWPIWYKNYCKNVNFDLKGLELRWLLLRKK